MHLSSFFIIIIRCFRVMALFSSGWVDFARGKKKGHIFFFPACGALFVSRSKASRLREAVTLMCFVPHKM